MFAVENHRGFWKQASVKQSDSCSACRGGGVGGGILLTPKYSGSLLGRNCWRKDVAFAPRLKENKTNSLKLEERAVSSGSAVKLLSTEGSLPASFMGELASHTLKRRNFPIFPL